MCIRDSLERVAVNNVKNVRNAKAAIKKAFQNQIEGKGFSLVEVLSTCPTNWGMTPQGALDRLENEMIPYYPCLLYTSSVRLEMQRAGIEDFELLSSLSRSRAEELTGKGITDEFTADFSPELFDEVYNELLDC